MVNSIKFFFIQVNPKNQLRFYEFFPNWPVTFTFVNKLSVKRLIKRCENKQHWVKIHIKIGECRCWVGKSTGMKPQSKLYKLIPKQTCPTLSKG